MGTRVKTTRFFSGQFDWGDLSDIPEGTIAWGRQVDFGYPGQMRISRGMTRHVTASESGQTWEDGDSKAVRTIAQYSGNGQERLVCTKERSRYESDGGTAYTGTSLWDITTAGTANFITANIVAPSSSSGVGSLYEKPFPAVMFNDELFIVNGQSTFRTALTGAETYTALTNGIALSYDGSTWTTQDIGVSYGVTSTQPTATSANTTDGGLVAGARYGVRILGYDTTRGAYSDINDGTNADMQADVSLGSTANAVAVTAGYTSGDYGFDQLRIFRTQGDGGEYYHDTTLTGTDKAATLTMSDLELSQQSLYDPGGTPPDDFYLLESHNERLIGIGANNSDRLYYSAPSNGHEWAQDNYRELPSHGEPRALSSTGSVVHVHYSNGRLITLVGHDVKTAPIREDCARHWGAQSDASIARDTHKIVFIGNTGVFEFTGQACPQKLSHPINGTWGDDITRSGLADAIGAINEREGQNEYWGLLPQDNLLVRVPLGRGAANRGQARISIDRIYATGLGSLSTEGENNLYIGTNDGAVFHIDTGNQWGTTSQLLDTTVDSATAGGVVLTTATTTDYGQLDMPFVITSGAAAGDVGWITDTASVTSSATVGVTPPFSTTPADSDGIRVGCLPFEWYSHWDDRGYPTYLKHWKFLKIDAVDDSNSNTRNALMEVWAIAADYISSTPQNSDLDWEWIGAVDFERPELDPLAIDMTGAYIAFKFRTMDYQVARIINGVAIGYERLRGYAR